MKKKIPSLPILLGTLLILCGVLLVCVSQIRTRIADRKIQTAATQLDVLLPERTPGLAGTYRDSQMPVLEIDGIDYSALLEIPRLNIELPVANRWDTYKSTHIPSRFWGSIYDPPCVIGGSDAPGHFDFCGRIEPGTLITVTDTAGTQFNYTVTRVDRASHAKTDWLLNEDFDLTLFCRSTYSLEYIAVRCNSSAY